MSFNSEIFDINGDGQIQAGEILEMQLVTEAQKVESDLLTKWINQVEAVSQAPIHHPEALHNIIRNAQTTGESIHWIAICCQNFELDLNEDEEEFIQPLGGKRFKRFGEEISNFLTSFKSFGVNLEGHISVSNIEPLTNIKLGNMGVAVLNPIEAEFNINDSLNRLKILLEKNRIEATPFDHLETIRTITGLSDLQQIQEFIAIQPNPTMRHFLDQLYLFDLSQTAAFVTRNRPNIIWLDCQSFGFEHDVVSFRQAAVMAPNLPILAPFNNSGNWKSAVKPRSSFLTKQEILSRVMLIDPRLSGQEWIKKAISLPDEVILTSLQQLGVTTISSFTNMDQRKQVIQWLAKIGGIIQETKPEDVIVINIQSGTRVKDVIREALKLNSPKIIQIFDQGAVTFNGEKLTNFSLPIEKEGLLQIGKKRKIEIRFQ